MSTDLYTKAVLGVIALCLVVLAARALGLGAGGSEAESMARDRYRVVPIPLARVLVRIDSETGETWTAPLFGDNAPWTRVAEERPARGGAAPEAEAPAAPAP